VTPTSTCRKRERLQIQREREKLEKNLGSIADLNRLPSAIFVVDVIKEHIAIAEARKLNIPTFAIVDTNSNPNIIDFPIPGNDDASKSISLIIRAMTEAIEEGMNERKLSKDKAHDDKDSDDDDDLNNGPNFDDEEEEGSKKGAGPGSKKGEGDNAQKNKRPRKPVSKK
jgi:small subunit ribosomal protein S2